VKLVAARLGNVGNLRARLLAELTAVGVGSNGRFLNVVTAKGQVGRSRVVQVQVRIHVVLAVDREHVGGSRKTGGLEVAVAAAGIHVDARCGLRYVGDVIAAVGLIGDHGLIEAGRQVGIVGVHQWDLRGHFHRLRTRAHRHFHVRDGRLANVYAGLGFSLTEARSAYTHGVAARTQQRESVVPLEPVVELRVEPLASLFSVTVAPDTTAPLGSVTVPVTSPETSDCAIRDGAITAAITNTAKFR